MRSMAARDRLGGLADLTLAAMVLMRALFDRVLIETVGVGQSETEVAGVADTVVFCVQPGSGDSLQFMKAGIVEIPHVIAVTKADLGGAAERARADVAGALSLAAAGDGSGRSRCWPSPRAAAPASTACWRRWRRIARISRPRPAGPRPPSPERGLDRPVAARPFRPRGHCQAGRLGFDLASRPARSRSSGCASWRQRLEKTR